MSEDDESPLSGWQEGLFHLLVLLVCTVTVTELGAFGYIGRTMARPEQQRLASRLNVQQYLVPSMIRCRGDEFKGRSGDLDSGYPFGGAFP
jgi:hypothetical protein